MTENAIIKNQHFFFNLNASHTCPCITLLKDHHVRFSKLQIWVVHGNLGEGYFFLSGGCEELVPIFHAVKFAKCEICDSTGLSSIIELDTFHRFD